MTQPTGNMRKLPYPLFNTEDLESEVGSEVIPIIDLTNWADPDPDVRVPILLELSLNEYVALASAVDVGRDIAYGDNSLLIWWIWVRSLASMDFCQMILDCIESTPALQQAIATYSNSSAITQTTPEQQTILDTDVFGEQDPCNNDEIYGMTVQMTSLLNTISSDILELFVTAFSTPGRIGDIIEAVPGLGILPFDDMFQMVEKMAVQVFGAYEAAYDVQIAEDISCDLFCIAKDTCSLTMEQARDYFQSKVIASLSNTDFLAVIEDILVNNWIGEQSIYMMHWFILDTIIFGGETLGIDTNRIVQTIATYFNDPNSDWTTLCTNCPDEWTHVIGDEGESFNNYIADIQGFFNAGDNSIDNGGSQNNCSITFPIGTLGAGAIQKVDVRYDQGRNAVTADFILFVNNIIVFTRDAEFGVKNINHNYVPEITSADNWDVYIDIGLSSGFTSRIERIKFYGTGVNPFL